MACDWKKANELAKKARPFPKHKTLAERLCGVRYEDCRNKYSDCGEECWYDSEDYWYDCGQGTPTLEELIACGYEPPSGVTKNGIQ
jgi:hypothetical protein